MSDKKDKLAQEHIVKTSNGRMYSTVSEFTIRLFRPKQCVKCGYFDFGHNSICPSCGADLEKQSGHLYFDPIELTEEYKKASKEVEEILKDKFPKDEYALGDCHKIWEEKRKLLWERGISWRSPDEMNKGLVYFD